MNEKVKLSPMIKGLTPGLPELGKLKLGMKGAWTTSQGGKSFQLPQKVDHWIITTLERGPDGNFLKDEYVHHVLGEEPKEIPITLLYDDPTLNFQCRWACFVGDSLWCTGDGEKAIRKQKDGTDTVMDCTCERAAPDFNADKYRCKTAGVLSVILSNMQTVGGVYKFRTGSYNSVINIMSSLALIQRTTGGVLAGIPLMLTVRPKTVIIPKTKRTMQVYVAGIEYRGSMKQLADIGYQVALENQTHRAKIEYLEETARAAITPEMLTEGETEQDIAEEFYPESVTDDDAQGENNGKYGDMMSSADREMGMAEDKDPEPELSETTVVPNDPKQVKDTAQPKKEATFEQKLDAIEEKQPDHSDFNMPKWVLDNPKLDEFLRTSLAHFTKVDAYKGYTMAKMKKDAEDNQENFITAFKNYLAKTVGDSAGGPAEKKPEPKAEPKPKADDWDPLTAELINRYTAEKKKIVMEAMEARGMEVNPNHSGNKLHFLLLNDVRKRGLELVSKPAETPLPAARGSHPQEFFNEPDIPVGQEEKTTQIEYEDEFDALVNSDAWQEMSALKTKHFKLYAQVTGGRTPRTAEQVDYIIGEITRLAETETSEGMPGA